ncbi:hypothetical protein F4780DRAFT_739480 [Xylariomycetidae sp. FL0641]|nr:hypothetical protein F4780DRAFT_739480 [Xylariomycetidae sp. FL0641]
MDGWMAARLALLLLLLLLLLLILRPSAPPFAFPCMLTGGPPACCWLFVPLGIPQGCYILYVQYLPTYLRHLTYYSPGWIRYRIWRASRITR